MNDLANEYRYAVRRLAGAPVFTLTAALCVAIGIGATVAIFGIVDSLLLRPIAGVGEPDRVVDIGRSQEGEGFDTFGFPTLMALRERSRTTDIAGWMFTPLALSTAREAVAVMGAQVTSDYFDVLRVRFLVGSGFVAAAPGEEEEPRVVISESLWRRSFGADPAIVGSQVRVNGAVATVVGVAGGEFAGTVSAVRLDAWVPYGMQAAGLETRDALRNWNNRMLVGVGRLRPGSSSAAAGAEMASLMAALLQEHPDALRGQDARVAQQANLPQPILGGVALFMSVLMAVVGAVLLVACVNVAGMVLARALARRRDVAIRVALGATRARIVREQLVESSLLFGLGGLLGVGMARVLLALLRAFEPPTPPPLQLVIDAGLDVRVLAFAVLVTALSAVGFGVAPAIGRATRANLVDSIKGTAGGSPRPRGRRLLMALQVAATVVLLVTAGLFVRALSSAARVDLGFDSADVYALGFDANLVGLEDAAGQALFQRVREGIGAVPGVERAAITALLPLGIPTRMGFGALTVDGHPASEAGSRRAADVNVVSPGYFDLLRMPLVEGAGFDDQDVAAADGVIVINEQAARFYWPDATAVGRTIVLGEDRLTVRGVVADAKYSTLSEEAPFFVYLPVGQRYVPTANLLVRVPRNATEVLPRVREAINRLAPEMPVTGMVALQGYVAVAYLPQRVAALVAGSLGVVAVLLACVGMYGMAAQAAMHRVREVGIRMALGAGAGRVARLVVLDELRAPAAGMAIGVAASLALTRFLASFLHGVSALDPLAFCAALALLAGVTALANFAPARRTARVDPVKALRAE